jgi:hypothetical protein
MTNVAFNHVLANRESFAEIQNGQLNILLLIENYRPCAGK